MVSKLSIKPYPGTYRVNNYIKMLKLKVTTYSTCQEKPLDLQPSAPQELPDCQDLPNFLPRAPSKLFNDFEILQHSLNVKLFHPEYKEARSYETRIGCYRKSVLKQVNISN